MPPIQYAGSISFFYTLCIFKLSSAVSFPMVQVSPIFQRTLSQPCIQLHSFPSQPEVLEELALTALPCFLFVDLKDFLRNGKSLLCFKPRVNCRPVLNVSHNITWSEHEKASRPVHSWTLLGCRNPHYTHNSLILLPSQFRHFLWQSLVCSCSSGANFWLGNNLVAQNRNPLKLA